MEAFIDTRYGLVVIRDGLQACRPYTTGWAGPVSDCTPAHILSAGALVWDTLLDPEVTVDRKANALRTSLRNTGGQHIRFRPVEATVGDGCRLTVAGVTFLFDGNVHCPIKKVKTFYIAD